MCFEECKAHFSRFRPRSPLVRISAMRPILSAAVAVLALASVRPAAAVTFYDGTVDASPTAHGLLYGSFPFQSFYSASGGMTSLNTSSSDSIYAGFGEATIPLDRTTGYDVRFDVRIDASSGNATRAGFSVIAIGNDLKGVEIAFKPNSIFAQNQTFTAAAESASFDTTSFTRYDLSIVGNVYTLTANNSTTVLTGPLKDYSGYPITPPLPNPYVTANSLFFGDDSTSAGGTTAIRYLGLTVPEPATLSALGAVAVIARRRRV